MNPGITVTLGAYGVGGAVYSEIIKQPNEQSGRVIAFDIVLCLSLLSIAGALFRLPYKNIQDDRESPG